MEALPQMATTLPTIAERLPQLMEVADQLQSLIFFRGSNSFDGLGVHVLRFPYAIALAGDALACADTANNRVLFWHGLPDENASCRPADYVIGQYNFEDNGENRWDAVIRDTMCWPYGIWMHNGRIAVADSGNNRVMIWTQMA